MKEKVGKKPVIERPVPKKETSWLHTPANRAECLAIKAVAAGTATPDQQKIAMQWIIINACRTRDLEYRPCPPFAEHDTYIAIGKRSVGLEIQREIDRPPELVPGYDPNSEQGI